MLLNDAAGHKSHSKWGRFFFDFWPSRLDRLVDVEEATDADDEPAGVDIVERMSASASWAIAI